MVTLVRYLHRAHRHLHSFPTRRSSDLDHLRVTRLGLGADGWVIRRGVAVPDRRPFVELVVQLPVRQTAVGLGQDRKSTRLNSSHGYISYAVFCLKKKNKKNKYD